MALSTPLTTELIHATADQLQAEGIRPTLANVRERLGGGSFSTIGEAMKLWKAEKQETAQLEKVVIPQEIGERLQLLGAELWGTAQDHANALLSKEREALQHKEALFNDELEQYKNIVATVEAEQAESLIQLDTLTNERDFIMSELEQLHAKKAEIEQDNEQLQYKFTFEHDRANDLLKSWNTERDKTNAQAKTISTLTADNATATAELLHANKEITRLNSDLANSKEEYSEQIKNLNNKIDTLNTEKNNLSADNAKLAGKLEAMQTQAQQALEREKALNDKLEQLTAKLTAQAPRATNKKATQ